ncbi:phosphoenolpyruvate carboxykinase (ATP) [Streptococcus henryi]|uniref:phosphoenolpyruvate carboxykinase (ATP) n=1 Tax=Streptococcus henryi TaxID=439219 RepID=A0A1G6CKL8_9STRE|nr:phosphoenolpyruvate carboxykinase (ATP) [Streptococcus henryi]SDB33406.1 phosphoenolpyruvate carboxykinase (ATP) [Streptococcus henryi]
MVTRQHFSVEALRKDTSYFSPLKTTVESAFYENHVQLVKNMEEAYHLAYNAPNTIVLDMAVAHANDLGLPEDARVLLSNSGAIVGRTAKARRIYGKDKAEDAKLLPIVRDAIFNSRHRQFLKADAVVGLDEDFMLRAHLMLPEDDVNNLYSWLMNFQILDETFKGRLSQSKRYEATDIYIFSDPTWTHPDYPDGLAYFDTNHNCAVILGMYYFGELKKSTLTLAWGTAARNGYVSCHGGLKIFRKDGQEPHVASFFGLSGSGKSTLTHAKHDGKYEINVLHDDAFIISATDGSSIALEPAYFDKTSDYPAGHPEQDYFVTVQNCGVALDTEDKLRLVTEDVRNGNGRTVKSRYATPNRVDKIEDPIHSIFWIMKDDSLPPLVKIDTPAMAATMGCTLMTMRSSAENTSDNLNSLIIEPYANPFRVYPLDEDYRKFENLFESGVDCYIINTGSYLGKKIPKELTLSLVEHVVDNKGDFKQFGPLTGFSYVECEGYEVPEFDTDYRKMIKERMQIRLNFLLNHNHDNQENALPAEAITRMEELFNDLG